MLINGIALLDGVACYDHAMGCVLEEWCCCTCNAMLAMFGAVCSFVYDVCVFLCGLWSVLDAGLREWRVYLCVLCGKMDNNMGES
jgi:hypothetical protein